ncbi:MULTISPECIES: radical SAM/SPASM domain-containing protein [Petrotoga]|uniref:Radical SAM core domain-containing protein n=2 Tax=Petrotoga sibirica TaxID=156202 RepID=A0A4R8F4X1_9BACT|nr:radical SAM protein [Petrotoga sp. SL27]POZ88114.1 hypothetical protein AA80_08605 [Petrotoga sibirica DSM 13575]POZ90203.1 hypothetical protein AD60_08735 [Petrotoga sp. SL27]TDX17221.1 uncharacterized protein C8D74_102167 [Petrotoga sibirica]
MLHQSFLIMGGCNLSCSYCYYRVGNLHYSPTSLKPSDVEQWLKKCMHLMKIESITFTGGEPLLRRDFFEFVKIPIRYGIDTRVLTNGTLLTDKHVNFFRDNNVEVCVSIDSISSNYHEQHRGGFERTMEGILKLRDHKVRRRYLTSTISKGNFNQIEELINFARQNNFGIRFHPIAVGEDNPLFLGNCSNQEQSLILNSLNSWAKLNNKKYYLGLIYSVMKFGAPPRLSDCTFARQSIVIDSDGSIYPCYQHKDDKMYRLGNITQTSPKEVEENKRKFFSQVQPASCIKTACLGVF